jgi:hypothetical protein
MGQDGNLIAVCDTGLTVAGTNGERKATYSYDDHHLREYTLGGSGFTALLLNRYTSGSVGRLVTVNSDGEDSKMRGWAGTELGNKVSDTLISIKSKTQNGVTFTVKQQDARDKDIDDWKFEITDDAGNLGIPRIITSGANLNSKSKEQPECDDIQLIREWVEQAKDQYEWPMSRKDIKSKVFGTIGGQKNDGKQQADLQAAINCGFLEESTIKSGGYYMLQPPEDLPF